MKQKIIFDLLRLEPSIRVFKWGYRYGRMSARGLKLGLLFEDGDGNFLEWKGQVEISFNVTQHYTEEINHSGKFNGTFEDILRIVIEDNIIKNLKLGVRGLFYRAMENGSHI